MIRWIRDLFAGTPFQCLALCFCVLLGLAMIANNQLEGEGFWFWYAILFHHGARLYADLHLALQPLLVLEMDLWMNLFGTRVLVTEIPSVIHLLALCLGLFLLLHESDWPDWQKGIALAGAFVLWTGASSYKFDDYHVTTEVFFLYSVILLFQLAKPELARRQIALTATMGVLCGFTITSRVNDGGALFVAVLISLLVLARKSRFVVAGSYVAATALTVILVVRATGDSFSDYVSNSLIKAAGSKGGTNSFLADPFLLLCNAVVALGKGKWVILVFLVLVVVGALAARKSQTTVKGIVLVQLGATLAIFVFSPPGPGAELVSGLLPTATPLLVIVTYALSVAVVGRFLMWKMQPGKRDWDVREILILVPFAELLSLSTSAGANPRLGGYCAQIAVLLLLVPIILPFQRQISWVNASFVTLLAMLAISGTTVKIMLPYAWENQGGSPMFTNRQWYRHPVYGPMYIQSDLLKFSTSICDEIGQGPPRPELLSLPFAYPNFFCDTPPWHGYVDTFFDTSTRPTIERLMGELETDPPQWIVYQRQLASLTEHERVYNHGQPLAQRDLDSLILQKIATGQWKLVDIKHYQFGDGWYVIRTRP